MTAPTTTAATEPTITTVGSAPALEVGEGSAGFDCARRLAVASDENDAVKPALSTELSARNSTYIVPDVAVSEAGIVVPLNLPSSDPCGPPS